MTVWEQRDLRVLRALAEADAEDLRVWGTLTLGHGLGAEALGLELDDAAIFESLQLLADAGYVEARNLQLEMGPGAHFTGLIVTGRGSQALGEWPLFVDVSPETLALFLERLAAEAPTDEEATDVRRAAAYVRGLSGSSLRALTVGAAARLARLGLGLG